MTNAKDVRSCLKEQISLKSGTCFTDKNEQ